MGVVVERGFYGADYPLTHGRVCWQRASGGTITATSEASGFPAANAGTVRTDSGWRPTAALSEAWRVSFAQPQEVSFLGIAKHDLGTQGATVAVEYSVDEGVTWLSISGLTVSPSSDEVLLFLMAPRAVDAVRVRITGASAAPTISVISVGLADEWPRPFTWPGGPITEGDRIGFENTTATTGNWLGRSVVSNGVQFELTMNHASEEWRQTDFAAFKDYANNGEAAFFVAARPTEDYLSEVAFAWLDDTARASREIPNRRVSTSVTLSCQGLRPYV